ncbi:hypothetical protein ACFPTR_03220 [Aliibacillus thermotolerans]|uniref:DUF2273 domain-containing protein n=1 Tax=Aliibacillus thermotolerans TaxID=1834418 RepID=A0ABW0U3B5_9BACI|nr:hypothetical protein [Aliibacillus thermotolerans]
MVRISVGLIGIVISFLLFILGLMKLFPLFIASLFLFLSIFYTVSSLNGKRGFKGIHS